MYDLVTTTNKSKKYCLLKLINFKVVETKLITILPNKINTLGKEVLSITIDNVFEA